MHRRSNRRDLGASFCSLCVFSPFQFDFCDKHCFHLSPGSICSCPTWETSCFCCSSCILTEWQTLWRNKMPQAVKHRIKRHRLSVLLPERAGEGKCHVKERMDEKWRWPLRLKWGRRSGGTGSAYVLPWSFYSPFSSEMAAIQLGLCSITQIKSWTSRTRLLGFTSLWVLLSAVLHYTVSLNSGLLGFVSETHAQDDLPCFKLAQRVINASIVQLI